jgi:hypothetical protein
MDPLCSGIIFTNQNLSVYVQFEYSEQFYSNFKMFQIIANNFAVSIFGHAHVWDGSCRAALNLIQATNENIVGSPDVQALVI